MHEPEGSGISCCSMRVILGHVNPGDVAGSGFLGISSIKMFIMLAQSIS
jgi:hypothetical protein